MKLTLQEVLVKVREENLSLETLESLRDIMIGLRTQILFAESDVKKRRALFLMQEPEKSAAARKMEFDASPDGLRLIELQADLRALPSEIQSLTGRIFSALRLQG